MGGTVTAAALLACLAPAAAGCAPSTSGHAGAHADAKGTSARSLSGATPAHLTVSGGYIPQPLLTDMAAAYVTLTNAGGTAADLTAVTTPLAAHVTLHTTTDGTMRQVTSLRVPPHGTLRLAGGADHLMLENLTHKPAVGEAVTLTLRFAEDTPAPMTVTVPVRPTTYTPKG